MCLEQIEARARVKLDARKLEAVQGRRLTFKGGQQRGAAVDTESEHRGTG